MSEVRQDLGGWSILTRTSFNLSNPWVSVNFLGSSCNQQLGDRHLVVLLLFQAYPPINWWKFTSWRGKKVDRVEYPRVGVQLWVFTTNLSLHFFSRGSHRSLKILDRFTCSGSLCGSGKGRKKFHFDFVGGLQAFMQMEANNRYFWNG